MTGTRGLSPEGTDPRAPMPVTERRGGQAPTGPVPVAVLGIGAVGGMLAARTGALAVGTPRTVAAVRDRGLRLVHDGETTVTRADAVERLERPVSLLVVAVKAHALEAALDRIAPEALDGSVVLPLQNGLEHVAAIRRRYTASDTVSLARPPVIAAGSIGRLEALSPEAGVVVQRTPGAVVTVASEALTRPELEAALEPLRVPGISVVVSDDEGHVLWDKAARLAVLAAATTASGLSVGPLRTDPGWRARLEGALAEACAVAAADDVELDPAGQWAIIEAMPGDLTTSTARDAAAGRPTELDAITGSVVRAGVRVGVPTPLLAGLLADAQG